MYKLLSVPAFEKAGGTLAAQAAQRGHVDAGPRVQFMPLCFALPSALKSSVELEEAVGPIRSHRHE
jgi:hypothetical protein